MTTSLVSNDNHIPSKTNKRVSIILPSPTAYLPTSYPPTHTPTYLTAWYTMHIRLATHLSWWSTRADQRMLAESRGRSSQENPPDGSLAPPPEEHDKSIHSQWFSQQHHQQLKITPYCPTSNLDARNYCCESRVKIPLHCGRQGPETFHLLAVLF